MIHFNILITCMQGEYKNFKEVNGLIFRVGL